MALYQAREIKFYGQQAFSTSDAIDCIAVGGEFVVPTGLALNDVIEFGALPAFTVPVDLVAVIEDLDTNATPTITLDAGMLSGDYGRADNARTCGNEFFAGDTTARTGGIARANKTTGLMLACTNTDRGFGLKVSAAAATLAVGAKIRVTMLVRPASVDTVFTV